MSTEAKARRSSWWALLPLTVFAGLAAAFFWGLFSKADELPSALVGRQVPEFALPPIEGMAERFSNADLRGKVSIVNVWASWCVPCRVEMPLLVELAETGAVPIFGINYKDAPEAARAFLDDLGNPYTRIVQERPDIDGITLPGMPSNAPGMAQVKTGTLKTYSFGEDGVAVYSDE